MFVVHINSDIKCRRRTYHDFTLDEVRRKIQTMGDKIETIHLSGDGSSVDLPDDFFFPIMTSVRSITLDHSKWNLSSGLFRGMRNLLELSMVGCSLKTLPSGIFDDLVSLENLELSLNEFEHLDANVFYNLTKLRNLAIRDNCLSYIDDDIFKNNLQLTHLVMNSLHPNPVSIYPSSLKKLVHLTGANKEIFDFIDS